MKLLKKCLSVLMTAVIAAASLIVGSTAMAKDVTAKEIPKIYFEPVGDELVVYLDGCGSKLLNKVVTYNRKVSNLINRTAI